MKVEGRLHSGLKKPEIQLAISEALPAFIKFMALQAIFQRR